MIKIAVVTCALFGVALSGVVPAIPAQYLQQQPQVYQAAGAPVLPPHLAAQARALPSGPLFRTAAPVAQPQQVQYHQPQVYQAQPQVYQAQPQVYQPAPQQVQYQPQPQQYRAQPAPAPAPVRAQPAAPARRIPIQAGQQQLENPEDYDANPSYNFGFDVKDDQFTNYQNRKEQREGDKISGSYSVVDSDGFIRTVTYTADPVGGFKAEVIREPTDIKVIIPTPPPATAQDYARAGPPARAPQQYAPAPQQQYAAQPQQYEAQQPQQYRVPQQAIRVAPQQG